MSMMMLDERFVGDELSEKKSGLAHQSIEAIQSLVEKDERLDADWTGWFDYPKKKGFELISSIESFRKSLTIDYDLVLVIGIGGSYLGTRAVAESLNHSQLGLVPSSQSGSRVLLRYAGHHICERELVEILDLLATRRPIVNVISKSGTTTEPGVAFRVVRHYLEEKFGKAEAMQRIVVTTDKEKGALKELADSVGYQRFEVPADIGGRYSVLSAVGMLPLALAGIPVAISGVVGFQSCGIAEPCNAHSVCGRP